MASPRTQVALAIFGLFALAAVAAVVLPDSLDSLRAHQLPGVPPVPGAPAAPPTGAAPIEASLGAAGQAGRVRIYSPLDPGITLVDMTAGASGTQVKVLGANVLNSGATAPILVEGDILHDELVKFNLPSVDGKAYWVHVDRAHAPACILLSPSLSGPLAGVDAPDGVDLGGTVCAPIAWRGEAANPSDVTVFNPGVEALNASAVFEYHDRGDGTSTIRYYDPGAKAMTTRTVPTETVRMQGSPFEAWWSVTVQPAGQAPTTFNVPLDLLRTQLAAGGAPNVPYLEVLRDALYDTEAYKAVTDGQRTYAQEELDGTPWLNGQAPQRIFVDVPERQLTSAPMVLLQVEGSSAPAQQLPTARGDSANGYVRHEASVPQAWLAGVRDGSVLRFSVAYKVTAAKVVTETFLDDNHGEGYRYRLDKGKPIVSELTVAADPARPHQLNVTWAGTDAGAGVATFKVDVFRSGQWQEWIRATDDTLAAFSGARGQAYQFRVAATDAVGIVGDARTASHTIPAAQGADDGVNEAPTVQLLQPTGGEAFLGLPSVTVKWRASDPDGTTPVINLFTSADGGATWRPLASPRARSGEYLWDIRDLAVGEYRLKVEATDGTLSNQDTSAKFRVDNADLLSAAAIGGGGQAPLDGSAGPLDGSGDGASAAQSPAAAAVDPMLIIGLALALIACAGVVAFWHYKNR